MDALPTKILLATDGSEDAYLATRAAIDLSQKGGSELHVVHVWHDVPTPHAHSFVRAQLRQEAQEILDKQAEKIEGAGGTVAKAHIGEGRTIDEILDLSEELQVGLLIVGSRGLGGVKRILMGSVWEGIVHHARRPVLVMRGGENAWPPARIVSRRRRLFGGRQESRRFGGKPRTALRGKCPPGANSPQALGRRPSGGNSGSLGSR